MRSAAIGLLGWLMLGGQVTVARAAEDVLVEDFEIGFKSSRWIFSRGAEFPGAAGDFVKAMPAAHAGQAGGRLTFDFTGGGNYVAAILKLDQPTDCVAVKLWVNHPAGNRLNFRYCDQTGQVHQKPFTTPKGEWSLVTITFDDWQLHYGGAKDGKVHGPPQWLAFMVENTDLKQGALSIDDISLTPGKPPAAQSALYTVFRFAPEERWKIRPGGNNGVSKLEGGKFTFDFTRGARFLALDPPDQTLLGLPTEMRLHLRGEAPGHTLTLHLTTHFMVFQRVLEEVAGPGEHEIVVPMPPGKDWTWFGGENDGILHGPLRLASLVLNGNNKKDRGELELVDVQVKTEYPASRACILLAENQPKDNVFVATVRSLQPEATEKAKLVWTLRNWDEETVDKGVKEMKLPALAEPVQVVVNHPDGAQDFLEAEFEVQTEGQKIAPSTAYYVGPLKVDLRAKADPAGPFGMGVYLYRYQNTPEGLADMDKSAELAEQAGVAWSREEFNWARIELKQGQYDWSFYDQMVATARKHHIRIYGLLAYWSNSTKPYTQSGIDDYCRFAAAVVDRYRVDVEHWEVWNEPNIFFWQGPKDMYAKLLKQAHDTIKKINPKAQVLGCSTAGIDIAFINKVQQLGGPFDVLTIHPYRAELHDLEFTDELRHTADLVKRADSTCKPVWITEMGWTTAAAFPWMGQDFRNVTQRQQAQYLARSYLDAQASGVCPNISWYNFRDDGDDPCNVEYHMGIVHRDLQPKPAYRAFATLTRWLAGKHFVDRVDAGRDVIALRFAGQDNKPSVIALWNPTAPLQGKLAADKPVQLINLMGQARTLQPLRGKVIVTAPVSQPVLVVFE